MAVAIEMTLKAGQWLKAKSSMSAMKLHWGWEEGKVAIAAVMAV